MISKINKTSDINGFSYFLNQAKKDSKCNKSDKENNFALHLEKSKSNYQNKVSSTHKNIVSESGDEIFPPILRHSINRIHVNEEKCAEEYQKCSLLYDDSYIINELV